MKYEPYYLKDVYNSSDRKLFKVVSMFAGGGSSSTGYRLAGGEILAINEFVESAQECYNKNYPNTYIFKEDIRSLNGDTILNKINLKKYELDILDGSPPCASFSVASIKKELLWGKEKKYSTNKIQKTDDLFFEFIRVLNDIQPKVFVCENVKGLTHEKQKNEYLGENYNYIFGKPTILSEMGKCGYNINYKVLNAKNYKVPQSRERLFIIGVRKDINKFFSFPKQFKEIISLKEAFENLTLTPEDLSDTKINSQLQIDLYRKTKPGESFEIHFDKRKRFSDYRLDFNKPSYTLVNKHQSYFHPSEERYLTIKEAMRICSFPDDYYLGKVRNQKFERLSRSVPPKLMEILANSIYEQILKN